MMAIWPVGPPNEMNPSLIQKRNASRKLGLEAADLSFMKSGTRRLSHFFYIEQYLLHQQIRPLRIQTSLLRREGLACQAVVLKRNWRYVEYISPPSRCSGVTDLRRSLRSK